MIFLIILGKFNTVIAYIEDHIGEELDVNYLAEIACCSAYDFQRTFSFAAEMSIAEYIRKRRLTLAGADLQRTFPQGSGIKVIDAAMKYGYDSPVSFSRAFHAFHGVNPSEVKAGAALKTFPRMEFQVYMKAVSEIEIVEKSAILIGCFGNSDAGALWSKWGAMSAAHEIKHGVGDDEGNSAAHEVRFYPKDGERIFVGVEVKKTEADSPWEYLILPSTLYAVFEIDEKIDREPQSAAIEDWLSANSQIYKRKKWDADNCAGEGKFAIYRYDHRIGGKYRENRVMEMWIPIKKITE